MDDDGSVLRVEQGAQLRGQIQRYKHATVLSGAANGPTVVEVRAPPSAIHHVPAVNLLVEY
jgi:hypothetical protein